MVKDKFTKKPMFTKGLSRLYRDITRSIPDKGTRGKKRGANNPRGSSRSIVFRGNAAGTDSGPKFGLPRKPKKPVTFGESVAKRFAKDQVRDYQKPAIIEERPKAERSPWKRKPKHPTAVETDYGIRIDLETGKRYRTRIDECKAALVSLPVPTPIERTAFATLAALKRIVEKRPKLVAKQEQLTLLSTASVPVVAPSGSYCPWPVFVQPEPRRWERGATKQEVLQKLFYK